MEGRKGESEAERLDSCQISLLASEASFVRAAGGCWWGGLGG